MDAVTLLITHKVGALAIVRDDKVVGVFTERDLMTRVVGKGKDPNTTPIAEVMTTPVRVVRASTPVASAASLMRSNHFRHLPVVDDDGRLVGMVALRYLLYDLLEELDVKVDDLHHHLMEDSRGG
jgi:CBS domain-containing protein